MVGNEDWDGNKFNLDTLAAEAAIENNRTNWMRNLTTRKQEKIAATVHGVSEGRGAGTAGGNHKAASDLLLRAFVLRALCTERMFVRKWLRLARWWPHCRRSWRAGLRRKPSELFCRCHVLFALMLVANWILWDIFLLISRGTIPFCVTSCFWFAEHFGITSTYQSLLQCHSYMKNECLWKWR